MTESQAGTAETGGMDFSLVREFVAETIRLKEVEKQLKADKADLEGKKQAILDGFAEQGVGQIRIDGKTVYTHRQLWAGKADALDASGEPLKEKGKAIKVDNDEYIDAIKAAGLEHMVKETVAASTLSSWVREIDQEDDDGLPVLPPELVGMVKVTEKFDVRVRKA